MSAQHPSVPSVLGTPGHCALCQPNNLQFPLSWTLLATMPYVSPTTFSSSSLCLGHSWPLCLMSAQQPSVPVPWFIFMLFVVWPLSSFRVEFKSMLLLLVNVLPKELRPPLLFALPDHTRFTLVDFPLHLPLELLGVDTCLKVLMCIVLENKVILQSRDYNALSMSVMAFVAMLYPLEYMFPIIPLLPTCMSLAEQLLLSPTPYIIGVPASFFLYKKDFLCPDDVWVVDLDSSRIIKPSAIKEDLPPLPEPEGSILKNHLCQVLKESYVCVEPVSPDQGIALASMSMTPQPIKNLDTFASNPETLHRHQNLVATTGFNPLIYGNDVDSVDVATRVAMVRFFNSSNTLGNFSEHTRTLRLYPRPVVAFQLNSFLKSRPNSALFTTQLARTQAVEFFAEWALCPANVVFLRVQTGVYDPLLIGDKPKWYSQALKKIDFCVYDDVSSTLGAALQLSLESKTEDIPTDESGSDSESAESTSSSYSSLSDFVIDIQNSDINGETPDLRSPGQVLMVDEACVFDPPCKLQVPDTTLSGTDSALSAPDSDDGSSDSSSESSSPTYSGDVPRPCLVKVEAESICKNSLQPSPKEGAHKAGIEDHVFRYDSGRITPTRKDDTTVFKYDSGNVTPTRKEAHFTFSPTTSRIDGQFKYDATTVSPKLSPKLQSRKKPMMPDCQRIDSLSESTSLKSIDSAYDTLNRKSDVGSARQRSFIRASSERKVSRNTGRIPPQRPPPPSPVALSKAVSIDKDVIFASRDTVLLKKDPTVSTRGQEVTPPVNRDTSRAHREAQASLGHREALEDSEKVPNITDIIDEINGYAQTASHTLSELFDGLNLPKTLEEATSPIAVRRMGNAKNTPTVPPKSTRPFAPLGNRKALVEKSGLVKHSANKKGREPPKQPIKERRNNTRSDNQQFLKDMISKVLEGQGVGWLKITRVKKLMEDENYRNFVVSRLNTSLDKKLTEDSPYIEDVAVTKPVFKGMLTMMKALSAGLEHTYHNHGIGGMGSAFMVLEILHTHCWEKEVSGESGRSDTSNPSLASSPYGSRESLSSIVADSKPDSRSLHEEHMVAALGSPVIVNGDEFENIEVHSITIDTGSDSNNSNGLASSEHNSTAQRKTKESSKVTRDETLKGQPVTLVSGDLDRQYSSGYGSESGDMLRELVKNKELMLKSVRRNNFSKCSSVDSDLSDGSTLMTGRKKRLGSLLSAKSHMSKGFRYHDGKLLNVNLQSPENNKTYLFEHLIGKDRSWLWDHMQFWEDAFLDAVAQERDIIGMDQGPGEMMDRYSSLGDVERKRLEHDEDQLLSAMLFNMVAFMVMMRVSKNELRRKVRRLLGKSHIGLAASQEINNLLEQINDLHGNDIDLHPLTSRMMQKQSFTVHWGPDNSGDMLFMEVCDDCLILRSVTGAICDRWWYEKLVNMTYCPKTKVLCLWRKHEGMTQLNKFYTKKCKELYFTVKEAMEKAAARNNGNIPGPDLGGEFPVQDLRTGEGGLLQVCMEGIGLLFANSKLFIELSRIKKCFTQKGGIFVLEEFDPKNRKIVQRKYKSSMTSQAMLAFHRVVSIQLAAFNIVTNGDTLTTSSGDTGEVIESVGGDCSNPVAAVPPPATV
ncbi:MAP kinase-activating death domain protein [Lamellibrachia satsuma]|nr:MAP kinase-activating death domain protein [Lamellibrachia satsuma]